MKDVCLVIPTIRENCFNDFVKRWSDIGLFDHVDLMVMEDNPDRTIDVHHTDLHDDGRADKLHYSWLDINLVLGEKEWIIPRRSDTVRSFAYYMAWKQGYKYILTLDDDCYPPTDSDGLRYKGEGFVKEHLKQLQGRGRWFNTLNSVKPRGIPFYNIGKNDKVVLNHGLWTNVLDYDAPYQLANPIKEEFSFDNRIVPAGSYFPMCGMNVMWDAKITVLMYHLLMGRRKAMLPGISDVDKDGLVKLPFDRFGDIWCGVLMKKVLDHLRLQASTGMPYVRHERASNPFTNLKKEANGIEVNEDFWEFIDGLQLKGETPEHCYREIGEEMYSFPIDSKKYAEYGEYFALLGKAMVTWAEMFGASGAEK